MSTRPDALDLAVNPDRVFYELGVMLDKEDFSAEQTYHRGRLARALAFLHGSGTAAGLKVDVPDPAGGGAPTPETEEVHVAAGLAVDAIGRLIEVPSNRCIRLGRWLASHRPDGTSAERAAFDRLRQAFHPAGSDPNVGNIVLDVLIRFAACERGKTPAFVTGPFDALDAVQPSRVRDGFELQLVPRIETPLPLPVNHWPVLSGGTARQDLHDAIFTAWEAARSPDDLMVPTWLDARRTNHWLFLARLEIPATQPTATNQLPARIVTEKVVRHNELRPFVYTTGALARVSGFLP